MCFGGGVSKSPTSSAATNKDKDPVYMRNPYLDGLGIGAENAGRNSLKIDMGTPVPNSSAPFLGISPNPVATSATRGRINSGLGIG